MPHATKLHGRDRREERRDSTSLRGVLCQAGTNGQRVVPTARTKRVDREAADLMIEQRTQWCAQSAIPRIARQQYSGAKKRDRE